MKSAAPSAGFLRNVVTLATGKAAAGIVSFAAIPIVSRLFGPEEFGVLALFTSACLVLSPFVTLRYEQAIVLPREESIARSLVILSACIAIVSTALLAVLIAVTSLSRSDLPVVGSLGGWVWWLPPVMLVLATIAIVESYLTRKKRYRTMARGDFGGAALTSMSRIVAGATGGSTVGGLITSHLLGLVAQTWLLVSAFRLSPRGLAEDRDSWRLKQVAREYRDFALLTAPSGVLNQVSSNLAVFAVAYLFGPVVVGLFAMSRRVLYVPVSTVSRALRRVFVQRAAELSHGALSSLGLYGKTVVWLVVLGLVPFGLVYLAGEPLFAFVLGEDWREAGAYAALLSPWIFSLWVMPPASGALVVLRRQDAWMRFQVIAALARVAVFVLAFSLGMGVERTLSAFAWVSAAANFGLLVEAYWYMAGEAGSTGGSGEG